MSVREQRIFDTGPLSAFATAGMLGMLKILSAEYECVLLDEVALELRNGERLKPALAQVASAEWLRPAVLASDKELQMYSETAQYLVGSSGRNVGETAVIAWARAHPGGHVVLDDRSARNIAKERYKLPCTGSVGIIIDAINQGGFNHDVANAIADELQTSGNARLPFRAGGFVAWAQSQGAVQ